jgi:hypothetical protein
MAQFHESPVTNTYRLQLFFKNNNVNIGSTRFFFSYSGGSLSQANMGQLSSTAATSWHTHFGGIQHPNTTLDRVIATDLNSTAGFVGTTVAGTAGTSLGTELPVSNCVLVNYTIGTRYRGGKPRNYLPIGDASFTANGKQWSQAFHDTALAATNGFLTDMLTPGVPLSFSHVSVSYYSGHQTNDNPGTWGPVNEPMPRGAGVPSAITSVSVNLKIGVQRRRLTHEA